MIVAGLIVGVATVAVPGFAADQTLDATLASTVSMTGNPTAAVSDWTLASSGSNTTSGGNMTVNANSVYVVSVTADKTRLSEWDTDAYVTDGAALGAALNVIAARTGGTALVAGVGATAVVGTSTTLATGTGGGTDTYGITLSQLTAVTDEALPAGRTYHTVLTYTASSSL